MRSRTLHRGRAPARRAGPADRRSRRRRRPCWRPRWRASCRARPTASSPRSCTRRWPNTGRWKSASTRTSTAACRCASTRNPTSGATSPATAGASPPGSSRRSTRGTRPNGIFKRANQLNVEGSPAEATGAAAAFESFVAGQQPGMGPVPRHVEGGRGVRHPGRAHAVRTPPTRSSGMAYTDQMSSHTSSPPPFGCTYSFLAEQHHRPSRTSGAPVDGAVAPSLGRHTGRHHLRQGQHRPSPPRSADCKWTTRGRRASPCPPDRHRAPRRLDPPRRDRACRRGRAGPRQVAPASTGHRRRAARRSAPAGRSPSWGAAARNPVTTEVPTHVSSMRGPTRSRRPARDRPGDGGIGTIISTAHYELTFKRVNEDGSPYTG